MTNSELDALIAERVMHFKTDPEYSELWLADGGMVYPKEDFRPSTDMRYAMMVVQDLLAMGVGDFSLEYFKEEGWPDWSAIFGTLGYRHADTPELAICKAALAAKGVRLDDAK